MYCPKCGTKNSTEAKFCNKCGVDLSHVAPAVSAVRPKPQNASIAKPVIADAHPATTTIKKNSAHKKLYYTLALILVLFLAAAPEAKAFYSYYSGNKKAAELFSQGNYSGALEASQSINQKGLPKNYKETLNADIAKYRQVVNDDQSFNKAKQDEQGGQLDDAKTLLAQISEDGVYPKNTDVIKELSTVNDKITSAAQAAAATSAAQAEAAQKQAAQAAAQEKSEEVSKEKAQAAAQQAAANAAANQAEAQAAQAEAAQQQAAATEAQEQEAQAAQSAQQELQQAQAQETSAYTNAMASGITLLTTADDDFNYAGDAVVSGEYSLALEDLATAQNDTYDATHDLPDTYPSNFATANTDFIDAADYMNQADQEESTAIENLDSSEISTAYSNENLGEEYFGEMTTALTALGY